MGLRRGLPIDTDTVTVTGLFLHGVPQISVCCTGDYKTRPDLRGIRMCSRHGVCLQLAPECTECRGYPRRQDGIATRSAVEL